LDSGLQCDLTIIPVESYDHSLIYKLPVRPSPNLPGWESVYLYPSLGLFEGTIISVGRGTDVPFQIIGHPEFHIGSYVFIPESKPGATDPPYQGQACYGQSLHGYANNLFQNKHHFTLFYLIGTSDYFSDRGTFFNSYFNKLAGNATLKKQIQEGKSEEEIRLSWEEDLIQFQEKRNKYLIYNDF